MVLCTIILFQQTNIEKYVLNTQSCTKKQRLSLVLLTYFVRSV